MKMLSIYGESLYGPTNFKCSCGGKLYVEKANYGLISEPNNFYCSNCWNRKIVDDDTLMEEYFKALHSNEIIAKRRFENWRNETYNRMI